MQDPRTENLGYFSQATSLRQPDKVAIIDLWGEKERTFTYGELEQRFERVAGACRAIGLKPGDRLAILVGNRVEFLELFFGAMRAGVLPIPLNVRQGRDALEYMVADADCSAAVVDPAAVRDGFALVDKLGLPVRVALDGTGPAGWSDFETLMAAAPLGLEPPVLAPLTQAFQPYTSGSTGRPKGVMLTHYGQLWSIELSQRHWPVSPEHRALIGVPLFHKNAMRGNVKPTLFGGGSIVLMPQFEPRAFLQALSRHRCTHSGGVPAIFTMILQHRDLIESLDFSALKTLSMGSAVAPAELQEALAAAFPMASVKESYGLTEGGGPLRSPIDGRKVPRGSCGYPAPEHELKLTDPEGRETKTEGELWIRSPYVPIGYYKLPDLTKERIVDGWLRTGDLFRIDEGGFFFFLGRTDDMFSCGGENVYPKEVENLIMGHPGVVHAAVLPIAHKVKGLAPAAMVAVEPGTGITAEAIKQHCLANGPAYAHPRQVVIVEKMPLNGTGKVDKVAVKAALDALAAA